MIKTIVSIILAIVCGLLSLKVIGLLFTVAFVLLKYAMVVVIAIPAYFIIKKLLSNKS